MYMQMAAILGPEATARVATSALPGAPVRAVRPRREHTVVRRLLGALPERRR